MFQCKDLLTLPSMAKARIIAGKSGLSNRIRWVYKPENMNFAKWVKTANAIPTSQNSSEWISYPRSFLNKSNNPIDIETRLM